jgi:hypothetical protein
MPDVVGVHPDLLGIVPLTLVHFLFSFHVRRKGFNPRGARLIFFSAVAMED